MEHLSIALRALFGRQKGDDILSAAGFVSSKDGKSEGVHLDTKLTESQVTHLLQKEDRENYSIDQLSMTGQLVLSKWMMPDINCLPQQFVRSDSVFNALLYFASATLRVADGDPECRYSALLRWHLLTTSLGEDIFTTAYLASRNVVTKYKRKHFDWPAFLRHDCKEINAIFEKPMADLHMHLKGSSFNFDISWICLMNHIEDMRKIFDDVALRRKDTGWDNGLYEKIRRAAAIRLYLAGALDCVDAGFTKSNLLDILSGGSSLAYLKKQENEKEGIEQLIKDLSDPALLFRSKLEKCLENTKSKIDDSAKNKKYVSDYIPVEHYDKEPVENLVMASERRLMYNAFWHIFEGKETDGDFATLFYAYLAYKEEFRSTILQLNSRIGFANFAKYEQLKNEFVLEESTPLLYKSAIEGFIQKHNNRYVEVRITPKDSPEGIAKSVEDVFKVVEEDDHDKNEQCSIVLHFIKKRDESFRDGHRIRHRELREDVKQQAYAIYRFRQQSSHPTNEIGRVVGIDAANSEIYARPEVFAQAFRFLRGHELFSTERDRPDDLNITYHVGEDFLDLADGLRAVEEAMIFLELRTGDRLGHALALGVDVKSYYQKRADTICESKQVILDNLAWLHHKATKLMGACPLCGYLEMMFHKYFREVYNPKPETANLVEEMFQSEDDNINELDDVKLYYLSWLLRGNSPTFGSDLSTDSRAKLTEEIDKQWTDACLNHRRGPEMACRNSKARELYDMYHSKELSERSNSVDSFTVPNEYREEYYHLLELIQSDLLDKIQRRHIAIECNPSSNYKIGDMERYDQHPIVKFYNYGLDTPYPARNISVSINTDDQGVFSTSLEREYSLMALAMERYQSEGHFNSPRAIVNWLDSIRQMSMEQRFDK